MSYDCMVRLERQMASMTHVRAQEVSKIGSRNKRELKMLGVLASVTGGWPSLRSSVCMSVFYVKAYNILLYFAECAIAERPKDCCLASIDVDFILRNMSNAPLARRPSLLTPFPAPFFTSYHFPSPSPTPGGLDSSSRNDGFSRIEKNSLCSSYGRMD